MATAASYVVSPGALGPVAADPSREIDRPGPGVAALGAVNFGGQSMVALNFYLYGDQAAETAAQQTRLWDAWFQERFPMPSETSQSDRSLLPVGGRGG